MRWKRTAREREAERDRGRKEREREQYDGLGSTCTAKIFDIDPDFLRPGNLSMNADRGSVCECNLQLLKCGSAKPFEAAVESVFTCNTTDTEEHRKLLLC